MCGIAGFLGAFPVGVMDDLQRRLAHRGPDGVGTWADPAAGIGLVHRRLSIIDLSSAASQPMSACDGRYTVVFNGEIYNFQKLVPLLKKKGYVFNPHSDTAVLAPLYDLYGPAMLEKLEGMFAFSIWDAHTRTLFAARDPLGIKPFYYAQTPQGFVFASELKALMGVSGLNTAPDPAALAEYLTYLYTPSDRTMVQGIRKLRPGHALTLKAGEEARITRWYTPPQAPLVAGVPQYNDAKTPADLCALLDEVIAEQCVSDVPVGAFLSGGVDSSAIVASMCATGHAPARAYCIGFTGAGMASEGFGEDIDYARMVARRYNIMLNEVVVEEKGVLARLPGLATMLDEPEADPAPLFVEDICRAARADGIKVMMSGTGGDDVMTGYRRHLIARWRERLGSFAPVAGYLGGLGARVLLRGPSLRRARLVSDLLRISDDEYILQSFTTNSLPDCWQLLNPAWRSQLAHGWRTDLTRAVEETQGQALVNRLLYAELFGFLPDHNLNYGDKASMAAGVEVRVPLIDRRVLQFMADVAPEKKLHQTRLKAFFKESMSTRLPSEILNRSKTGFGAPIRGWLTGEGRSMVEETLFGTHAMQLGWFDPKAVGNLWQGTQSGRIDGAYTVLALCMALWWQQGITAKL